MLNVRVRVHFPNLDMDGLDDFLHCPPTDSLLVVYHDYRPEEWACDNIIGQTGYIIGYCDSERFLEEYEQGSDFGIDDILLYDKPFDGAYCPVIEMFNGDFFLGPEAEWRVIDSEYFLPVPTKRNYLMKRD